MNDAFPIRVTVETGTRGVQVVGILVRKITTTTTVTCETADGASVGEPSSEIDYEILPEKILIKGAEFPLDDAILDGARNITKNRKQTRKDNDLDEVDVSADDEDVEDDEDIENDEDKTYQQSIKEHAWDEYTNAKKHWDMNQYAKFTKLAKRQLSKSISNDDDALEF